MKGNLFFKTICFAAISAGFIACTGGNAANTSAAGSDSCTNACESNLKTNKAMKYQKKYTNADFYKDGKLQADVALAAYLDMLEFYGVPYSENLKKNLWITDFNLGDFENVGMGGIFWVNDAEHNYFAHEIYLLPGQMIVEHKHPPTKYAAKHEAWVPRHGWVYNYAVGETTPNGPKLPESQKDYITVSNFVVQKVDEMVPLKQLETPHFLLAGDEGAIVSEYASYHDGDGLRFTNPNVVFTDCLTQQ